MGQNKSQAHHTSTYFHRRRVSIKLNCIRNPALLIAKVSFGSYLSDSVSCPYQRSLLLLRQRKLLPLCIRMREHVDPA